MYYNCPIPSYEVILLKEYLFWYGDEYDDYLLEVAQETEDVPENPDNPVSVNSSDSPQVNNVNDAVIIPR